MRDQGYYESCARIKFEHTEFTSKLKSKLEKYHSDVVLQRDEVAMRWAQGRAQELSDLIGDLENASDYLRKA
jgi:hypothetical protein